MEEGLRIRPLEMVHMVKALASAGKRLRSM